MASETKTEGAQKAGLGVVAWKMDEVEKVAAGTGYSTSHGGVIEGERMLVGGGGGWALGVCAGVA